MIVLCFWNPLDILYFKKIFVMFVRDLLVLNYFGSEWSADKPMLTKVDTTIILQGLNELKIVMVPNLSMPTHYLCMFTEFKIIYFLMGPWDPWAMILMGPRALGMCPINDVLIHWKFCDVSSGHRLLVADESLSNYNGYMMKDMAILESLCSYG